MSPHPVDLHVGKQLRMRRTIQGLSQEAIGRAIGVTFQQIQKYERGVNRMGSSRLYDFSRILKVPVSYFFEGLDQQASDGTDNGNSYGVGMADGGGASFEYEQLSTRETLEMMRAYYRIPDEAVRKRIYELIKSLAVSDTDK